MNLYDTLGVPRTATSDEIKRAYRKLAMKFHPDRNPGDHEAAENFKRVQEAYDTLSDSNSRARYDMNSKPAARPNKKKEDKGKRPYKGDGFTFADAPPPKVDLWGEPIQEDHKWVDAYATHYESDGQPDIRGR